MPVNINNKLKGILAGGSYGAAERKLDLRKLDFPEVPIHGRKKTRPEARPKRYGRDDCPFCGEQLPVDEEALKTAPDWQRRFVLRPRVKHCICGAAETSECPACKKPTWQKGMIYQHKKDAWGNCGFYGELKLV